LTKFVNFLLILLTKIYLGINYSKHFNSKNCSIKPRPLQFIKSSQKSFKWSNACIIHLSWCSTNL